ncbi:hypothetical protein WHR41_04747 [Cladosporium halotolerans]|uniref:Major facilitator superfamily (MFS) profile domain-containing protein n=1 Tax=Cladosporium halotolerans TaxID=1052096 RepID=A0AB34KMS2_9PEZI
MDPEKTGIGHHEALNDDDVVGEKKITHEEAEHLRALSPEEKLIEKKLKKKIDALIMPTVVVVYLMNYIDRNNYAAARLQGLVEDLNLEGNQYQTGLSILFVGYVLMQVPSNAVMNYVGRPSIYIGFFTAAWGLVSLLTSQTTDFGSIVACRFILGIVEAPFFAGVLFYLSKWYTKSELNLRMSIFYSASLMSGAFGPLIAAGILSGMDGARGLGAWQWLYIIEGAITILIGLIVMVVLPDFPDTWKSLSPEEKHVANRRLALDAAEADVDEPGGMSQLRGIKLAFLDPKTWVLAIAYHGITGAAGFQNFFPTLAKETFNYDSNVINLLLAAPPYVFIIFWSLGHSLLSDRVGNRFWFFLYPVPIVLVGCFIFMFAHNNGARYFSLFLMMFIFAMNGTTYAWIANAIPRPPAKRAAALAFINSFGNAASIWTPFTYFTWSSPYFHPAMGIIIGLTAIAGICGIILRFLLERDNKRLARLENESVELSEADLKKLQKTADMEGIDIATARQLQKGYRFMI